jgi:hypothetical protein
MKEVKSEMIEVKNAITSMKANKVLNSSDGSHKETFSLVDELPIDNKKESFQVLNANIADLRGILNEMSKQIYTNIMNIYSYVFLLKGVRFLY